MIFVLWIYLCNEWYHCYWLCAEIKCTCRSGILIEKVYFFVEYKLGWRLTFNWICHFIIIMYLDRVWKWFKKKNKASAGHPSRQQWARPLSVQCDFWVWKKISFNIFMVLKINFKTYFPPEHIMNWFRLLTHVIQFEVYKQNLIIFWLFWFICQLKQMQAYKCVYE